MSEMLTLTTQASLLAAARNELSLQFAEMQSGLDAVQKHYMPRVHKAARRVAAEHARLSELIDGAPELFDKPRTQTVNGLRFGLQKRRGKMRWASDEQLAQRIYKLVDAGELAPEQVEVLLVRTERPVAKALEQLDGRLLKKLGVTVDADCDEVLIKSVDSAVEKAVAAVIKEMARASGEVMP